MYAFQLVSKYALALTAKINYFFCLLVLLQHCINVQKVCTKINVKLGCNK